MFSKSVLFVLRLEVLLDFITSYLLCFSKNKCFFCRILKKKHFQIKYKFKKDFTAFFKKFLNFKTKSLHKNKEK